MSKKTETLPLTWVKLGSVLTTDTLSPDPWQRTETVLIDFRQHALCFPDCSLDSSPDGWETQRNKGTWLRPHSEKQQGQDFNLCVSSLSLCCGLTGIQSLSRLWGEGWMGGRVFWYLSDVQG